MTAPNTPLSREEIAVIHRMHSAGKSAVAIAKLLNRSPETVRRFLRGETHMQGEAAGAPPSQVPGTPTNAEVEASAERLKKLLEG